MAQRGDAREDLARLRARLAARALEQERAERERFAQREHQAAAQHEFQAAVPGVTPLAGAPRHPLAPVQRPPQPFSRWRDDAEVLRSSLSDEIDVESLLDTDDTLSYRKTGIGHDVVRRLRRGHWTIQAEIDLHGHRVEEARHALASFLREAAKHGVRCVRVVHGKGLGSRDRVPILKGKVRAWLAQREEVIAFCQARAADGGAGALLVLLRPVAPGGG